MAVGLARHVQDLHEDPHPGVRGYGREVPVEGHEHNQLHLQDLLFSAGAIYVRRKQKFKEILQAFLAKFRFEG